MFACAAKPEGATLLNVAPESTDSHSPLAVLPPRQPSAARTCVPWKPGSTSVSVTKLPYGSPLPPGASTADQVKPLLVERYNPWLVAASRKPLPSTILNTLAWSNVEP